MKKNETNNNYLIANELLQKILVKFSHKIK